MQQDTNTKILSLIGLKMFFLFAIFYWHTNLPKVHVDLGARCCEFFFVISGFLVAYNLHRKNYIFNFSDMIPNIKRKLLHLYPIHILTFFISLIFLNSFNSTIAFFNITLLQSWTMDSEIFFGYNGVSWFLSSILFCYFLAPLLMNFIKVFDVKKMALIFFGAILIRFLIEFLPLTTHHHLWDINYHIHPPIRALEFFIGMLILPVFLYVKNMLIDTKYKSFYFGIIEILSVLLLCLFWKYTEFIRAAYIPFICIIIFIFAFNKGYVSKLLSNKLFIVLGYIELEFFMFHQVIIRLFSKYAITLHNIYLNNLIIFLTVITICFVYKILYTRINTFCHSCRTR